MPLKEGEKVEIKFFNTGEILDGVVNTVNIVGDRIRYVIECTTTGIIYLVDEIRGDSDTLN